MDFYKKAIGAKVETMMRWKDCPDKSACTPQNENKVMHASVKVGDVSVMASDGRCEGKPDFKGFALSLTAKTDAEADKLFAALSDGGQVQMPLGKTILLAEVRHVRRQVRRRLDGPGRPQVIEQTVAFKGTKR